MAKNKIRTFWGRTHKLSRVADQLNELVPREGSVENPKENRQLERFRIAGNLYYEIYNNGGMNYTRGSKAFFGVSGKEIQQWAIHGMYSSDSPRIRYRPNPGRMSDQFVDLNPWSREDTKRMKHGDSIVKAIEQGMADIVKAAAKEQGIL